MTGLDSRVRGLQARVEAAQAAKARAEGERQRAAEDVERAREALRQEQGVSTVEEASALAARLEERIEAECKRVTGLLESARRSAEESGNGQR